MTINNFLNHHSRMMTVRPSVGISSWTGLPIPFAGLKDLSTPNPNAESVRASRARIVGRFAYPGHTRHNICYAALSRGAFHVPAFQIRPRSVAHFSDQMRKIGERPHTTAQSQMHGYFLAVPRCEVGSRPAEKCPQIDEIRRLIEILTIRCGYILRSRPNCGSSMMPRTFLLMVEFGAEPDDPFWKFSNNNDTTTGRRRFFLIKSLTSSFTLTGAAPCGCNS